jgi:hypothetical protein
MTDVCQQRLGIYQQVAVFWNLVAVFALLTFVSNAKSGGY